MPPAKRKKSDAAPGPENAAPSKGAAPSATAALDLDGVIGQAAAVKTLRSAVASGRVHHAWVFHGPVGVGKFTAACAFAAELLGVAPARLNVHPDFHVVRKELALISRHRETRNRKLTNIPREVLLEFLVEPLGLHAAQPGPGPIKKVFIIDEAEMLDVTGQNTLLKSLEEPPPGSMVVLVTSDESALLPTIRSRSQRVAFRALDAASMARWVAGVDVRHDPYQRDWLLKSADGSPGAFVRAVAAGLYEWHETLEPKLAQADRGAAPFDLGSMISGLVDARAAAAAKESANASKDVANRLWTRRMFEYLGRRYGLRVRDPDCAAPQRAVAMHAVHLLSRAESQIDANVRFPEVIENFVAQLALAAPSR